MNYKVVIPTSIENDITKKSEFGFFIIFKLLLIFMGTIGSIFTFSSMYKLPLSATETVFFAICAAVLFTVVFSFKKLIKFTAPALMILFSFLILHYRTQINTALLFFRDCFYENQVLFDGNTPFYLTQFDLVYEEIRIFVTITIFLVAGILAISLIPKARALPVFLITFPFFEAGAAFGLVPNYYAFLMILTCWVAAIAMRTRRNKKTVREISHETKGYKLQYLNNMAKSGIIIILITSALFCGFYLYTENIENLRPPEVDHLREEAKNQTADMFGNTGGNSTGVSGGNLNNLANKTIENTTHLRIETINPKKTLYLRGFVGSRFENDIFTSFDPQDITDARDIANYKDSFYTAIQFPYDTMLEAQDAPDPASITIKNLNANNSYIYAPYNAAYNLIEIPYIDAFGELINFTVNAPYIHNDEFVYATSDEYSFKYFVNTDILWNNIGSPQETRPEYGKEAYSRFVKVLYTQYNKEKYAKTTEKYSELRGQTAEAVNQVIKNELGEIKYDLQPGKTPPGSDLVNYFLYTNKKGYCAHFAASATMMFRAAGIPARYVEGYLMTEEPFNNKTPRVVVNEFDTESEVYNIELTDAQAHAWVEIYDDTFGWVPIEVTPGYGNHIFTPEEIETIPTAPPVSSQAPTSSEEMTPVTSSENNVSSAPTSEVPLDEVKKPINPLVIVIVVAIIVLAGAVITRYSYVKRRREKALTNKDLRARANAYFDEFERILSFAHINANDIFIPQKDDEFTERFEYVGENDYKTFKDIVFKARFSNHAIRDDDAVLVKRFVVNFQNKYFESLGAIKRIKSKILYHFK